MGSRWKAAGLAMAWTMQTAIAAEPVKLTVGYQPYDTISYSAAVIRALELWKKHLPPGSEVEFQNALQGSIIVNQMLAKVPRSRRSAPTVSSRLVISATCPQWYRPPSERSRIST
jgi:hypothetical protein